MTEELPAWAREGGGSEELPDWAKATGTTETAKKSVGASDLLAEAVKPFTSMPTTYAEINRHGREQMAAGTRQLGEGIGKISPSEIIPAVRQGLGVLAGSYSPEETPGLTDIVKGATNIVGGGLEYGTSPLIAPVRSLASQPIENVTGIPKEYTEFALSLVPWFPKSADIPTRAPPGKTVAPTAAELRSTASGQFDAARESGVSRPASEVADLATRMEQQILRKGARPYNQPKTFAWLEEAKNSPEGAIADAGDLHGMRIALGDAAASEGYHASAVKRTFDRYLQEVTPELKTAIANWAALERAGEVSGKLESAQHAGSAIHSGLGIGNKIRQRFAAMLDPEHPERLRGYRPDEIAAIREIADGTPTLNGLRLFSNVLGGGGGLGSLAAAAMGHGLGGLGVVGFPAAGMGLRYLGNMLTTRKVNQLDELIRSRSPMGADMATQQAEREAAARWSRDYISAQGHPSLTNMRNLNASSRGLALVLNRDLGVDAQKAIPYLQAPLKGAAGEQEIEIPRPPPYEHHGGAVEDKPQRARGGHVTASERQPNGKPKLPHSAVAYVSRSPHVNKRCGLCSMYVVDDDAGPCTLVVRPIASGGYCRRFLKRSD